MSDHSEQKAIGHDHKSDHSENVKDHGHILTTPVPYFWYRCTDVYTKQIYRLCFHIDYTYAPIFYSSK